MNNKKESYAQFVTIYFALAADQETRRPMQIPIYHQKKTHLSILLDPLHKSYQFTRKADTTPNNMCKNICMKMKIKMARPKNYKQKFIA